MRIKSIHLKLTKKSCFRISELLLNKCLVGKGLSFYPIQPDGEEKTVQRVSETMKVNL